MINKVVIFDLDSTLINIQHRLSKALLPNGDLDYPIFNDPKLVMTDKIITKTFETYNLYEQSGYIMILMTGRDGSYKKETEEWLSLNNVRYDTLYIREENDYLKDSTLSDQDLKRKWLYELTDSFFSKEDILCVYEDRQKVVDMWREEGLICYQPDYGDF